MSYPPGVDTASAALAAADEPTPLRLSRTSRRRIGAALIAYGMVGAILALLVAGAGLWGALRLDDAMARIEAQRVELVGTIGAAADALASTIATVDAARPGFDQLASLTARLGGVAGDAGSAVDDLAGRMDVSVLGFQPFAGLGAQMSGVAGQLRSVSDELAAVGPAVDGVAAGTAGVMTSLAALQARLEAVSGRIEALGPFDQTGRILAGGLALVILLDLWLVIPAVTAVVVGRRLRRG